MLVKEKLVIKGYVKYMDDFILIHCDKWYLQYCLEEINKVCNEKLNLELNQKTQIEINFFKAHLKYSNEKCDKLLSNVK